MTSTRPVKPLSTKNFASRIGTFFKGEKTRRDMLQTFIVFALHHYAGTSGSDKQTTGDTTYLTVVLRGCIGVKSLPSITIKDYIKEHANVHWVKAKDGTMVFRKVKAGEDVSVNIPEVSWYEWEGANHNAVKPDFDLLARVKGVLTAFDTAIKEGRSIKELDKAQAEALKKRIDVVLAA